MFTPIASTDTTRRVAPGAFRSGDPAFAAPVVVDGFAGELVVDRHGARVTWIADEHEYTIAGSIAVAFRIVATHGVDPVTRERLEVWFNKSTSRVALLHPDRVRGDA